MKSTLETLVVSRTAKSFHSSFIELISTIPLLPCESICLYLRIFSTRVEDPWELSCQLVLFIYLQYLGMYLACSRHFMNVYWVTSTFMSKYCANSALSSRLYVVLVTLQQDRYYYSYHSNKISGTQISEVTCSKLHCWWVINSLCLSDSKVHVSPSYHLWRSKA